MTAPLVSVILVSYRTRELTARCLTRLRALASPVPHEVIVVDNASDDGSAQAAATADPAARVLCLPRNVGFARAVNAGARVASGRWLLLINPDTTPDGDPLAAMVDAARADPAAGIYIGRTLRPDGGDDGRSCFALPSMWGLVCFATGLSTVFRRSGLCNPDELPRLDRSRPARVPAGSGCLLMVERELFAQLDGFAPEYFMYSEDADLCARAAQLGADPLLVPEARVVHLNGASSTGSGKRVMVLRGKVTYLRRRWSQRRATLGRALLVTGVAARAVGSRLTGRAVYWRQVWAARGDWLAGWPPLDAPAPPDQSPLSPDRLPG